MMHELAEASACSRKRINEEAWILYRE